MIDLTREIHVVPNEEYSTLFEVAEFFPASHEEIVTDLSLDFYEHGRQDHDEVFEAYRRLFEAAPKMLKLLKDSVGPYVHSIPQANAMHYYAVGDLIQSIENPKPTLDTPAAFLCNMDEGDQ